MTYRRGFRTLGVACRTVGFVVGVWASASTAVAVTTSDLARMARADGDAYLATRDAIVAEGAAALIPLRALVSDEGKSWDVRLAAGICSERIEHGADIVSLDSMDWRADPGYDRSWPITAAGFPDELAGLVQRRLTERGYWFHYMEVYWKGVVPTTATLPRFAVFYENATQFTTGVPRLLCAYLTEHKARTEMVPEMRSFIGHGPYLATFVKDGTLPSGVRTLILRYFWKGKSNLRGLQELLVLLRPSDVDWAATILSTQKLTDAERSLFAARLLELQRLPQEPPGVTSSPSPETAATVGETPISGLLPQETGSAAPPLETAGAPGAVGTGQRLQRWVRFAGIAGVAMLVGTWVQVRRRHKSA